MGKEQEAEHLDDDKLSFTVEEVVKQLGVTPRTLHYYEEVGLVEPASRTAGGHRLYDQAGVEKLRRILRLKESLGYSLQEIKSILDHERVLDEIRASWHSQEMTDEERQDLLDESVRLIEEVLGNIDEKLKRLKTIRKGFSDRLQRIRDFQEHQVKS